MVLVQHKLKIKHVCAFFGAMFCFIFSVSVFANRNDVLLTNLEQNYLAGKAGDEEANLLLELLIQKDDAVRKQVLQLLTSHDHAENSLRTVLAEARSFRAAPSSYAGKLSPVRLKKWLVHDTFFALEIRNAAIASNETQCWRRAARLMSVIGAFASQAELYRSDILGFLAGKIRSGGPVKPRVVSLFVLITLKELKFDEEHLSDRWLSNFAKSLMHDPEPAIKELAKYAKHDVGSLPNVLPLCVQGFLKTMN